MRKSSKTMVLAVSIALIALVWVIAIIACNLLILELPWMCWGSISCALVAVIASEIYLLIVRKEPSEQGTEPGALGVILTICYLLITILLNSIFVLLRYGNFNMILLVLNLAATVCYIILTLWIEQHTARLTHQLRMTEQKTASTNEIGRKLGELLAITEDAEIRGKLLKLKEAVDYSTNISTNATAGMDTQMIAQLDEIVQLSIGRADRLIILKKVDAAEVTWKMRSSTASSKR